MDLKHITKLENKILTILFKKGPMTPEDIVFKMGYSRTMLDDRSSTFYKAMRNLLQRRSVNQQGGKIILNSSKEETKKDLLELLSSPKSTYEVVSFALDKPVHTYTSLSQLPKTDRSMMLFEMLKAGEVERSQHGKKKVFHLPGADLGEAPKRQTSTKTRPTTSKKESKKFYTVDKFIGEMNEFLAYQKEKMRTEILEEPVTDKAELDRVQGELNYWKAEANRLKQDKILLEEQLQQAILKVKTGVRF